MTVPQYLLIAAIFYTITGFFCYYFIYKPAKRKLLASVSKAQPLTDTESYRSELHEVEGRQVLVVPAECELGVSRVSMKRLSGGLVIYPSDKAWSDYARLIAEAEHITASQSEQSGLPPIS